MQFYGKAEESAKRILSLFESGDVPKALAPVFIRRNGSEPCRKWSWSNQLLTALAGYDDARGFRQWQDVGRYVRKGEHGFPILCPVQKPITKQDKDTGETATAMVTVGFTGTIVFGYEQTDGKPLPDRQAESAFLDALPLLEVAKSWGLTVKTFEGERARYAGFYSSNNQAIALGVENQSTWAHELVHAADDRLGALIKSQKGGGQYWSNEIVAELGGAILLECMGYEHNADKGGCWQYVSRYAKDAEIEPIAGLSTGPQANVRRGSDDYGRIRCHPSRRSRIGRKGGGVMLAEKYRPQSFEQVIGQPQAVATMKWYLDQPHKSGLAFLIAGPSGSGKTTLAECAARYWGVADWDIHKVESAECDVETLRKLAGNMRIYGVGKDGRKLYVIDEIHTVTGRAADRMLSLLESLPPHVVVVGTTTESDWTDGILLSRWIRIDLAKVRSADVAEHLENVAKTEGLPIPADPKWAEKLVKYHGLNIRDQLNQLPARLLAGLVAVAA